MAVAPPPLHPPHKNKRMKTKRSDITPDPGGHRPQRPRAQGRTRAKQEQAQRAHLPLWMDTLRPCRKGLCLLLLPVGSTPSLELAAVVIIR